MHSVALFVEWTYYAIFPIYRYYFFRINIYILCFSRCPSSFISSDMIMSRPGALLFLSFCMMPLISLYVDGGISTFSFRFYISRSLFMSGPVLDLMLHLNNASIFVALVVFLSVYFPCHPCSFLPSFLTEALFTVRAAVQYRTV